MTVAIAEVMHRLVGIALAALAFGSWGCGGDTGVVRYHGGFECSDMDADQAYVDVDYDLGEVTVAFVPSAAPPGEYVLATDPSADIGDDRIVARVSFAAVEGEEAPLELELHLDRVDGERLEGEGTLRRPDDTAEACSVSFAAGG